jgi:sugar/nucleoside kinase (ribokinase family)
MLAYPGVSKKLLDKVQIDEKSLNSYKVIMSEGYIWDHPGNPELITEMFRRAKKQGVHTAFTFGDKYIVEKYREEFIKLASELDILFLNEREALALIETDDIQEAVEALQKMCSLAIVTVGEKGAMIVTPENINYIKAVQVKNIVDRTGAGDQFAAGFLYGYMNNLEHVKSGEIGAKNASYILTQMGAKPKNKLAQSLEGKL